MSKNSLFSVLFFFSLVLTACDWLPLADSGSCENCNPVPTCDPAVEECPELCNSGLDDDDDGLVNCDDPDCYDSEHCRVEICDNGLDDDEDGFVDCNDPDCDGIAGCPAAFRETDCDDGLDNDEDGAIDCDDPNCVATVACRFSTETDCEDGQDNDQDGFTDCDDPTCQVLPVCTDPPDSEENCIDGIDNDFDDAVDCDDSDCEDHESCQVAIVPSVLSFRPTDGYRSGYCRDHDDTSWSSGSNCSGTVLLFTVYQGTTQFPNYTGTACRASTLEVGEGVAELHCVAGTDGLTCDPQCWAICGPQRYAGGSSQVSFVCVLDGGAASLQELANELSNATLDDDELFIETAFADY